MAEIRDVQEPVVRHAKTTGWLVRQYVMPGRRGTPDRFFMKGGRLVIIEFKEIDGTLALLQSNEIKKLRAAGMEVHVIDNIEDARAILDR